MGKYTIFYMFENPRRGMQARNFTTNVPKILDLKSSFEQRFFRKLSLGAPGALVPFQPTGGILHVLRATPTKRLCSQTNRRISGNEDLLFSYIDETRRQFFGFH